ncbi:MAG: ATP-binding cassette domain-containing protein [Verrucomicrobiota bacterium]|nr:ATP-binding cassette domain-containing protein [Verrucomicrobiota bacterium]
MLKIHQLRFLDWHGLTFDVNSGHCLGLMGRSGSGKTLLLRAIADLDVNEGKVSLNGLFRDDVSGPEWRKKVGLLTAESKWWHESVGQHFKSSALNLLSDLGFPDESVLSWKVSRLSSGEKQRLALARLLLMSPDALLLDEPTANLDSDSVTLVENVIDAYRKERSASVIWVAHDESQLDRVSDAKMYMKDKHLTKQS